MRFHDHHDTIMAGGYPKIHDKLKAIILPEDIKGKHVLDAGACTGSFGLWALRERAASVGIVEARPEWLQRAKGYAVAHAQVHGLDITRLHFDGLKIDRNWVHPANQLDTLIARRFIYELRDPIDRQAFIANLVSCGLRVVYLQGLVRVKNHKEPLWNVELEAQDFIKAGFSVTYYNGNDLMRLER